MRIRFSEINFNRVAKNAYDDNKPVIIATNKNIRGLLKNYCNIEDDFHVSYKYTNQGLMSEINVKSRSPLDDVDEKIFYNTVIYNLKQKRLSKKFGEFYNMKLYLGFNFRDTFTKMEYDVNSKTVICYNDDEFNRDNATLFVYNKFGVIQSIENFESKLGTDYVEFIYNLYKYIKFSDTAEEFNPISLTTAVIYDGFIIVENNEIATCRNVYVGTESYNEKKPTYYIKSVCDEETKKFKRCTVIDCMDDYNPVLNIKCDEYSVTTNQYYKGKLIKTYITQYSEADSSLPESLTTKTYNNDGTVISEVKNLYEFNDNYDSTKDYSITTKTKLLITDNGTERLGTETYLTSTGNLIRYDEDDFHIIYEYDEDNATSLIMKYYGDIEPNIRKQYIDNNPNRNKKPNNFKKRTTGVKNNKKKYGNKKKYEKKSDSKKK